MVSDPVSDPDSNPDSNPDPKCLFRIRIGSGRKFRILTDPVPDPDPQHCREASVYFVFQRWLDMKTHKSFFHTYTDTQLHSLSIIHPPVTSGSRPSVADTDPDQHGSKEKPDPDPHQKKIFMSCGGSNGAK